MLKKLTIPYVEKIARILSKKKHNIKPYF